MVARDAQGIPLESENGWRPPRLAPNSPLLRWAIVPGTGVQIQVHAGPIGDVMLALAADFHAFIEELRDDDSASYTETNSVDTSNHLNATAMDLDWNTHPFQTSGTFNAGQQGTIRELVGDGDDDGGFYEGWMFWAGYWTDPIDEMHWQAGYGTFGRDAALADFVARKIRSDGFSTFRRGAKPGDPVAPAPPAADQTAVAVTVLYDAVPVIDEARAAELLDPLRAGLALAQCTNPRRIAMALAQWGHESAGFSTTEEFGRGAGKPYYPYFGRAWTQVTWQSNYAKFGAWAAARGLIDDPDQFVDNPDALAELRWAGIASAWFWITPHDGHNLINDDADRGDVTAVTLTINGGTTNLADRQARYDQAIALGDRLLALVAPAAPDTGGTITLADVPQAEWDQLVADVKEIRAQLGGDGGWPQGGNDMAEAKKLDQRKAAGERLSLYDLVAWIKNHASTHKAPTP